LIYGKGFEIAFENEIEAMNGQIVQIHRAQMILDTVSDGENV
jgi:hypothetical protein